MRDSCNSKSLFFDPLNSYISFNINLDFKYIYYYLENKKYKFPIQIDSIKNIQKLIQLDSYNSYFGKSILDFIRFVVLKDGTKYGNKIIKKSSGYNFCSLFLYDIELLNLVEYIGIKVLPDEIIDRDGYLSFYKKSSSIEERFVDEFKKQIIY